MSNLPPGCTQKEIDQQLEDDYGFCPDCETRLVEEIDGSIICPVCYVNDEQLRWEWEHKDD